VARERIAGDTVGDWPAIELLGRRDERGIHQQTKRANLATQR
jgi:hypothetical protein